MKNEAELDTLNLIQTWINCALYHYQIYPR